MNTSIKLSEITDVVHYYIIKVYTTNGRNLVEILRWSDMRIEIRLKYDWYFKYRAALLQVQYPKHHVEVITGKEPATGKNLQNILINRINAKKGNITKHMNKLAAYKQEFEAYKKGYLKLFPIEKEEQYITYTESIALAVAKIKRLEHEVNELRRGAILADEI